jgi:hypothetical protein
LLEEWGQVQVANTLAWEVLISCLEKDKNDKVTIIKQ